MPDQSRALKKVAEALMEVADQMAAAQTAQGARQSLSEDNPKRLTGTKRRERRREIAEFVAQGHSHPEAARKFEVSTSLVAQALREFGVQQPDEKNMTQAELFGIAASFIQGLRDADIARQTGLSRERIRQIRKDAESAGLFDSLRSLLIVAKNGPQ